MPADESTIRELREIAREQGVIFATISHETQAIMMIVLGLAAWASFMLVSKKAAKDS